MTWLRKRLARNLLDLAYALDRDTAEASAEYWLEMKRLREYFQRTAEAIGKAFQPVIEGLTATVRNLADGLVTFAEALGKDADAPT